MMSFIFFIFMKNHLFSDYDPQDKIKYCEPIRIDDVKIIYDSAICSDPYNRKGCDRSFKKYFRSNYKIEYYIIDISSEDVTIVPAHASTIDIQNRIGSLIVSKDSLIDCNLHPLPPLTNIDDNGKLLLGTDTEGRDKAGLLIYSIFYSLQYALITLITFLISGLSIGILLGYYSKQWLWLSSITNYFNKFLESVPLLLWILISIYALKVFLPPQYPEFAWPILFIIFGVISSPALSKMIRLKFLKLADDEFVVALKMLGLSNNKIIYNHIIPYFCLPIIFSQSVYIFAQALFLDITLTYLNQFHNDSSLGFRFLEARNIIGGHGYDYFIIVSIIIFIMVAFMFSLIKQIDGYND